MVRLQAGLFHGEHCFSPGTHFHATYSLLTQGPKPSDRKAHRSRKSGTQAQLRAAIGESVDHLVEVHAHAAGLLRIERPERRGHAARHKSRISCP